MHVILLDLLCLLVIVIVVVMCHNASYQRNFSAHVIHRSVYVIRFYKSDLNRTSGNFRLTPPVESYTIVLLI